MTWCAEFDLNTTKWVSWSNGYSCTGLSILLYAAACKKVTVLYTYIYIYLQELECWRRTVIWQLTVGLHNCSLLFVVGFTGFTMPRLITIHIMMMGCFAFMPVQIHQVYVRCSYIIFVRVVLEFFYHSNSLEYEFLTFCRKWFEKSFLVRWW